MTTAITRSRVQPLPTPVLLPSWLVTLSQSTSSGCSRIHYESLLCRFDARCGTWRRGSHGGHATRPRINSDASCAAVAHICKRRTVLCASQGSTLTRGADLALALVLPVHSHVAMNNVISDYVPKNVAGKLVIFPCSPGSTTSAIYKQTLSPGNRARPSKYRHRVQAHHDGQPSAPRLSLCWAY